MDRKYLPKNLDVDLELIRDFAYEIAAQADAADYVPSREEFQFLARSVGRLATVLTHLTGSTEGRL